MVVGVLRLALEDHATYAGLSLPYALRWTLSGIGDQDQDLAHTHPVTAANVASIAAAAGHYPGSNQFTGPDFHDRGRSCGEKNSVLS